MAALTRKIHYFAWAMFNSKLSQIARGYSLDKMATEIVAYTRFCLASSHQFMKKTLDLRFLACILPVGPCGSPLHIANTGALSATGTTPRKCPVTNYGLQPFATHLWTIHDKQLRIWPPHSDPSSGCMRMCLYHLCIPMSSYVIILYPWLRRAHTAQNVNFGNIYKVNQAMNHPQNYHKWVIQKCCRTKKKSFLGWWSMAGSEKASDVALAVVKWEVSNRKPWDTDPKNKNWRPPLRLSREEILTPTFLC